MSRVGHVARGWGFDALIALLAVAAGHRAPPIRRDDQDAPADDPLVLHPGGRRQSCSRSSPAAATPFGAPAAFWLLAADGLVRRRAADPLPGRPVPRRGARGVPAREPARRRPGARRPRRSSSPAWRRSSSTSRATTPAGRARLHPAPVRDRLARRLRAQRPGRAGRRGRGTRRRRQSGTARRPPGSPSPRSGRGSRASSTTSSPTP